MVSHSLTKTTREFEIGKLITHRSWRRKTRLEGDTWEVKAEFRERQAGPGAHAFIRVCGCSALGLPD